MGSAASEVKLKRNGTVENKYRKSKQIQQEFTKALSPSISRKSLINKRVASPGHGRLVVRVTLRTTINK